MARAGMGSSWTSSNYSAGSVSDGVIGCGEKTTVKDVAPAPANGGTAPGGAFAGSLLGAEATGHRLLDLGHSQIALRLAVVEGHGGNGGDAENVFSILLVMAKSCCRKYGP